MEIRPLLFLKSLGQFNKNEAVGPITCFYWEVPRLRKLDVQPGGSMNISNQEITDVYYFKVALLICSYITMDIM